MRISLASDHAGFPLKERIRQWLESEGYEVLDRGTHGTESVDYPDYAARVVRDVLAERAPRGILVCGSGIGMSMAANRFAGIRAALCSDEESARLSRRHNDANVLTLGGRLIDPERVPGILRVWLEEKFEGGRHARRVQKIETLTQQEQEDDAKTPLPG